MLLVELRKLVGRPRTWVTIGLLAGLPTLVAVFLRVTEIGPRPGQGPAPSWHRCSATARCSRPPPSP